MSINAPNSSAGSDEAGWKSTYRRKIILVAFADGLFKSRKKRFFDEAKTMGLFDEIRLFDFDSLPVDFQKAHGDFIHRSARGFGYWIWKPKVIQLALQQAKPGDFVVYLDAGYTLNAKGRRRFLEYIDIAADSEYKMLSFQSVHTEFIWTKMSLAHHLGVERSAAIMNTSQLSSGFMILGSTKANGDFIAQWQDLAVTNGYKFSDDSASEVENHPSFREHRHDQSISSLLRKIHGTTITHYEVQAYDSYFHALKDELPALATRLKS